MNSLPANTGDIKGDLAMSIAPLGKRGFGIRRGETEAFEPGTRLCDGCRSDEDALDGTIKLVRFRSLEATRDTETSGAGEPA